MATSLFIARTASCLRASISRSAFRNPAVFGTATLRHLSVAPLPQQRVQQGGRIAAALVAFAAGSLGVAAQAEASADPAKERTFIAIKPDGVHRGLIADIIKRFEDKGFKLVGIKILVPTKELAGQHYAEHDGKPFFPKLVNFLSSGPVVGMVWEGKQVITYGRTMIGVTNPMASAPGTIRGDYGIDTGRNIIHGSDSVASAQREIALWFRPEELANWTPVASPWIYE